MPDFVFCVLSASICVMCLFQFFHTPDQRPGAQKRLSGISLSLSDTKSHETPAIPENWGSVPPSPLKPNFTTVPPSPLKPDFSTVPPSPLKPDFTSEPPFHAQKSQAIRKISFDGSSPKPGNLDRQSSLCLDRQISFEKPPRQASIEPLSRPDSKEGSGMFNGKELSKVNTLVLS